MGNKCFKRSSGDGESGNSKQKARKTKQAQRYAVGEDGQANEAYVADQRTNNGNFTNIAAIPVDRDGHMIHIPGEEHVHIEWANGPNHERPVDVPADQLTDHPGDGPVHNNHTKPHEQTVAAAISPHIVETSSLHSASSKGQISIHTDRELYSRDDVHPLAEPDHAKTSSIDVSDDECKSLSDISLETHEHTQKAQVNISSDFQMVTMHNKTEESALVVAQKTDDRYHSSSDSDNSDSDSEPITREYPDTNFQELVKSEGGYDNPLFRKQLERDENEKFTPQKVAVFQPVDVHVSKEVTTSINKDETDSLEDVNQSDRSESDDDQSHKLEIGIDQSLKTEMVIGHMDKGQIDIDQSDNSRNEKYNKFDKLNNAEIPIAQSNKFSANMDDSDNSDSDSDQSDTVIKSIDQSHKVVRGSPSPKMERDSLSEDMIEQSKPVIDHSDSESDTELQDVVNAKTNLSSQKYIKSEIEPNSQQFVKTQIDLDLQQHVNPEIGLDLQQNVKPEVYLDLQQNVKPEVYLDLQQNAKPEIDLDLQQNAKSEIDLESQEFANPETGPFGSFQPSFNYRSDEQGVEADRELSEIMMEIERIEDSLAQELQNDQNAEELSRDIVEKLDEITALREQSEIILENEYILDEDRDMDEDMPQFRHPGDVIQWYNTCMDDLNEKVGMALLELSMLEDCEDEQIQQQFHYHRDIQSVLIRKKRKYTRQLSASEPVHQASGAADRAHNLTDIKHVMDYYNEPEFGMTSLEEPLSYEQMSLDAVVQQAGGEPLSFQQPDIIKNVVQEEPVISQSKPKSHLNPTDIDLQFSVDSDNLASIADFEFNPMAYQIADPFGAANGGNPLELADQSSTANEDLNKDIDMHFHAIKPLEAVDQFGANQAIFIKESDFSAQREIQTGTKKQEEIAMNDSANVEATSSDEDEPQIGVNQFATPYRSEDDLWQKVEQLSSGEGYDFADSNVSKNGLHLGHKENGVVLSGQTNVELQSQYNEYEIPIHNGHDVISHQNVEDVQTVVSSVEQPNDPPLAGSMRASMMYGSDTSDSESEGEVAEPKIVSLEKLPSLSKHKILPRQSKSHQYDEDSDIEEMEVNYHLIQEMKSKLPETRDSHAASKVRSSESDSEVEELVNLALQMEEDSVSKSKTKPVFQNTPNLVDLPDETEFDLHDQSQSHAYDDYSQRLARDIVDSSSNAIVAQGADEGRNSTTSSQSSFEQIDFQVQTDQVEKSDFGVQENMSSKYESSNSAQTDAKELVDHAEDSWDPFSTDPYPYTPEQRMASIEEPAKDAARTRIIPDIRVQNSSDVDTEEIVNEALASESDDSDVDEVHREYNVVMTKPIVKAKPVTTSQSDSSSDENRSESDTEKDEESEDEGAAHDQLRDTLKGDIIGTIHDISAKDFKDLMCVYRDQRADFKQAKDIERKRHQGSLWEILEERRRRTDEHIHDGEEHEADTDDAHKGDTESDSSRSSSDDEEQNDVEESLNRAEELNQTIQLMDLEIVRQACENNNRDVADEMLEKHFELVEKMRKDKQESLAMHRDKMMKRLQEKHTQGAKEMSSSSSDDSCNDENTNEKDKFITQEMDKLTQNYLHKIKSKQDVDEQQLYDLLLQYREEQHELIRRREYEKLRIQEKLKERLKKRQLEKNAKSQSSSDEDQPKVTHNESAMDAAFYERMLQQYKRGDLDEQQLSDMIDQHLREMEQFKNNLRHKVAQRRKNRRHHPSDSMKMRMADDMVGEKNRAAEQIRHLRQLEKEKADKKLEEKMKKKKVVPLDGDADVSPLMRPARSEQRDRDAEHLSMNYDDLEYDV